MKKRLSIILTICFAVTTALFGLLWQIEKNGNEDLKLLAQASAADACAHFIEYQTKGEISSYWFGVAAFRSFEQAYHLLTEETSKSTNYLFCNEVYGCLVRSPERSQNHISEVIDVMHMLSLDVEDEHGYVRMAELRNSIQE